MSVQIKSKEWGGLDEATLEQKRNIAALDAFGIAMTTISHKNKNMDQGRWSTVLAIVY